MPYQLRERFPCLAVFVLTVGAAAACFAQAADTAPTYRDIVYDHDHESQRMDVYLAESEQPTPAVVFIHGGGWSRGSKNRVPGWLRRFVADGQLSVVSVEYRFTDVQTHPAQVNDCLRAIQFVRHNAEKWNVDAARLGVTGGSAGGHLSAYVALYDDVANPDSTDPVEQQSSRVACCVSFAGPTDWSLLRSIEHRHPAYLRLIGHRPGTEVDELDTEKMANVSPISFVSSDDPPMMQVHGDRDVVVPIQHAENLHQKLTSAGVESEVVVIRGGRHSVAGAADEVTERATRFVRKHLLDDPDAHEAARQPQ